MHIPLYNSEAKQKEEHRRNRSRAADLSIVLSFILVIFGIFFLSTYQLAVKMIDIAYNSADDKTDAVISRTKQFLANPSRGLPLTKKLTGWSNQILINQLQLTLVNDVIIGKNGWLFVNDSRSFDDYRGILKYTDQELSVFGATLESQKNWLSKQDIQLLLVFAPNKESIYPEFLPDGIKKVNNSTRLDQLINYLKINSKVEILDLRKSLLVEKSQYPLYYKTDSHWTSYGSFFGYNEIMKKITDYYPGLEAYPLSDYLKKDDGFPTSGDLASLIMMEDSFPEAHFHLDKAATKDNNLAAKIPCAVIYCDSFYKELQPFLSQHFEKISVVATDSSTGVPFNQDMIEKEHPDIVMYIMVERLVPRYFLQSYYFLK